MNLVTRFQAAIPCRLSSNPTGHNSETHSLSKRVDPFSGQLSPVGDRGEWILGCFEVLTGGERASIFRLLAKYASKMKGFLNITKALADENRLRILMTLQDGEVCVCQITELMGLAMSTVSKHLSILYQAGLVNARKEGRWMYYSLPGKGTPTAAREGVAWVRRSLAGKERIAEDAKRLKKVLAMDVSELCKRQCGS
jgi:ArsR family transcriptional regulator, arsenate/arsenite/antimonite-responsive transcriptional repressor